MCNESCAAMSCVKICSNQEKTELKWNVITIELGMENFSEIWSVRWTLQLFKHCFWKITCSPGAPFTKKLGKLLLSLTHWGWVTHICIGKLTIIGSDNGLLPGQRQAIIWTNDGILLNGLPGTNFKDILIEIHTFSFKKIHFKMSCEKWRPFCLGLHVLNPA